MEQNYRLHFYTEGRYFLLILCFVEERYLMLLMSCSCISVTDTLKNEEAFEPYGVDEIHSCNRFQKQFGLQLDMCMYISIATDVEITCLFFTILCVLIFRQP